ncbi:nitrate- and nitrite sensing domain-containing protein [Streptomyces sp. x-80]|uniref:sensor histidine kinase n=1 Tax=Streptomyces sp. x-80 TaxID=2789282 RepID=UPI0039800D4A
MRPSRPRDWRLTTRMTVVLALPVALTLGLAVPRVTHSLDRAERLAGAETTVRLVLSATRLAHALQNERDLAARTPGRTTDDVRTHRATTDRALADFRTRADPAASAARAVAGSRLTARLSAAERALGTLAELRATAFTAAAGPVATQTAYDDLVAPLLALGTEAGHGDDPAATAGWALHALSTGTAALSSERALLNAALAAGRLGAAEAAAVLAAQGVQERAMREFRAAAAPADVALLEKPAASTAAARTMAGRAVAAAQRSPRGAELPLRAPEWHRTAGQALDQLHTVETSVARRMLAALATERTAARRDAVVDAALVATALGLAGLIALVVAHSLVRRLRRLRRAALQAAEQQLPTLVATLSAQGPGKVELTTAPIDLGTRDEIGDVSRAFDAVFREAVRQTAEQAALRTGVRTMLASLSRRSQGLVYRQLDAISELERAEEDPAKLAALFRVDHLATRMRRHGENLLVLAGERPGRVHCAPAPLLDVVRAAAAEVEYYTRIRTGELPDLWLVAPAVHDLSHLLAELLENATQYSGPGEPVEVTAGPAPAGGLVLEIADRGVGLPAPKAAALNARLADPPSADVATTRQMGLYVVSHLAGRHGIRVRLRCTGGGCTAVVELPATLFAEPGPVASGDTAHRPDLRAGRGGAAPAPEPAPPPRATPPPAAATFPAPGGALPRRAARTTPPDTPPAAYDAPTTGTASRAPQPRPSPDELRRRVDGFHGGARRGRRAPGTPPDDRTTGHGDGRPGGRSGTPTGGARGTRRRAREPDGGGDGDGNAARAGEPDRGGSPDRDRREEG